MPNNNKQEAKEARARTPEEARACLLCEELQGVQDKDAVARVLNALKAWSDEQILGLVGSLFTEEESAGWKAPELKMKLMGAVIAYSTTMADNMSQELVEQLKQAMTEDEMAWTKSKVGDVAGMLRLNALRDTMTKVHAREAKFPPEDIVGWSLQTNYTTEVVSLFDVCGDLQKSVEALHAGPKKDMKDFKESRGYFKLGFDPIPTQTGFVRNEVDTALYKTMSELSLPLNWLTAQACTLLESEDPNMRLEGDKIMEALCLFKITENRWEDRRCQSFGGWARRIPGSRNKPVDKLARVQFSPEVIAATKSTRSTLKTLGRNVPQQSHYNQGQSRGFQPQQNRGFQPQQHRPPSGGRGPPPAYASVNLQQQQTQHQPQQQHASKPYVPPQARGYTRGRGKGRGK